MVNACFHGVLFQRQKKKDPESPDRSPNTSFMNDFMTEEQRTSDVTRLRQRRLSTQLKVRCDGRLYNRTRQIESNIGFRCRQVEKSQPEGKRNMSETRFSKFPALSVDPRVGISRSASETDV